VKVVPGSGSKVGVSFGSEAANVAVAESLAALAIDSAVSSMTVGRYSGG
jgi:hypothetical protein